MHEMVKQTHWIIVCVLIGFCGGLAACGGGGGGEDADAADDVVQDREVEPGDAETDGGEDPVPDGAEDLLDAPDADDADGDESEEPPLPDLRPMTAAKAQELGAYARGLHLVAGGGASRPVAWSMVHTGCTHRALVLEYVIASAQEPLGARPPDLVDVEVTPERIGHVVENPTYDAASINLTGPLISFQTLVLPDGSSAPGEPRLIHWPYHHGTVINVEGELMVLDLSVGNEPVTVDAWTHSFVDAATPCSLMGPSEWINLWSYWIAVTGSMDTVERPDRICGYTITPLLTLRWEDNDPTLCGLNNAPQELITLLDGFITILAADHSTTLPEEQIPLVTSTYDGQPESRICEFFDYRYCP
jgi:hypothetical protein